MKLPEIHIFHMVFHRSCGEKPLRGMVFHSFAWVLRVFEISFAQTKFFYCHLKEKFGLFYDKIVPFAVIFLSILARAGKFFRFSSGFCDISFPKLLLDCCNCIAKSCIRFIHLISEFSVLKHANGGQCVERKIRQFPGHQPIKRRGTDHGGIVRTQIPGRQKHL